MTERNVAKLKGLANKVLDKGRRSSDPHRAPREQVLSIWKSRMGREPNLSSPVRFSDKVLARIVGPSDPIYPAIGYKHLVPAFVKNAVGERVRIPKRLLVTPWLEPHHIDMLPDAFVLKSSYGAGINKVVTDKATVNWAETCQHFNSKVKTIHNARRETGQWNCIIAEEYIGEGGRHTPDDLKVHCFHKTDGTFDYLLQVDTGRLVDYKQSLYDANGTRLPFMYCGRTRHVSEPALPENLERIIGIARDLSQGFDYLRVDLYSVRGEVWFGELTPFHMGAQFTFDDPTADAWIGAKWDQRFPWFDRYNGSEYNGSEARQRP